MTSNSNSFGFEAVVARTIVEVDGAKFRFVEALETGQDAAGDWWVFNDTGGPITNPKIGPRSTLIDGDHSDSGSFTDRLIDGAMVNPGSEAQVGTDLTAESAVYGTSQGWDSIPGTKDGATPDPAKNDDPSIGSPLYLTEGTIFKAISNVSSPSTGRGSINRYVPLTVVTSRPAANAILGHPFTTTQALRFTTDDIDLSILPRLAVPTGQARPDIAALTEMMSKTRQYHWTNGNEIRSIHPTVPPEDKLGYGGQEGYARERGKVLMALTLDYTDEQLMDLAVEVVREGLAIANRVETGGVWEPNGGLHSGRLPILATTALLLNDANMLSMIDREGSYGAYTNKQRWHEYGQAFEVDAQVVLSRVASDITNVIDVSETSGYAQFDVVRATGGTPWNGNDFEWQVEAVGGSGEIASADDLTLIYDTRYHSVPTGFVNVVGGGTGLSFGTPDRLKRIYNDGMLGVVEFAQNYVATRNTSLPDSHLRETYRKVNRAGNFPCLLALRQITGMQAAMNADIVFDYHDRSKFMAGTILVVEQLTDFELAYWDDHRGYTDPAPGAPVVSESGCNGNVVWIKYNKYLQEDPANGVASAGDFSVTINGSAVTVVEANTFGDVVCLYLDTQAVEGDTVLRSYTKGTAPDVVKDWFDVEAASFTDAAVTNNTVDYVSPVPDSIIPNSDFNDPYNFWGGSSLLNIIESVSSNFVRFELSYDAGDALASAVFDVTGGNNYDLNFMVQNLTGGSAEARLAIKPFADGTPLDEIRLGGSTFTISANGLQSFSGTLPATATQAKVELRKINTGPSFEVTYFDMQYTA